MRPLTFVAAAGLLVASTRPVPVLAQEGVRTPTGHEVARVERMLDRRLACRGCHVIAGRGGAIGPTLDGLAQRSSADVVTAIIEAPDRVLSGTLMPRQKMPGAEVRRLTAYLLSLSTTPAPGGGQGVAPPADDPGRSGDGAYLYARHCAACHGDTGRGDGWNATNLPVTPTAHADPALMALRADDTLYDAIAGGGYVLDRSPLMPAFGEALTPPMIRALVRHIRVLCACEQPEWSRRGG